MVIVCHFLRAGSKLFLTHRKRSTSFQLQLLMVKCLLRFTSRTVRTIASFRLRGERQMGSGDSL